MTRHYTAENFPSSTSSGTFACLSQLSGPRNLRILTRHHTLQHCNVEHHSTRRRWSQSLLCWHLVLAAPTEVYDFPANSGAAELALQWHVMHLIVQGLINHLSVLQHNLCVLHVLGVQSREHVLHPLHIDTHREVRERELFVIRGALCHCACTVKSGQSGLRALPSR